MARAVRRRAFSNYAAPDSPPSDGGGGEDRGGGSLLSILNAVCNVNQEMLRVGESRARCGPAILDKAVALRFVDGNAQFLPFDGGPFDLHTIAFELRNVTDVDAALRDALRVLKPGGWFLCLEFSRVTSAPLASLYDTYSFNVISKLGELVANDRGPYQYLVESIRKFCTQEELASRMEVRGFKGVKYRNITGGMLQCTRVQSLCYRIE